MTRLPRRLVLPSRLAVGVSLVASSGGCPASEPTDAGRDVVAESAPRDDGPVDDIVARTDVARTGDAGSCDVSITATGYFQCVDPAGVAFGPGDDPRCATGNLLNLACRESDCPAGCVACPTLAARFPSVGCTPSVADGGPCVPSRVCAEAECSPGCSPVT
jgi:hypothetical protein